MTTLQKRTSIPLALPTSLPPKSERLQSLAIRQDRWTKYTIPNVDAEAVCRAVTLHKAFELQEGYVIPDLPKFSDLTSYGDLKEEDDDELCELEAHRLVQIANSETAIGFEGSDSMLGPADARGYFRLHWLGQRLIQALQICKHDALVVMIEHIDRNLRGYAGTQERLLAYFDPATGDERFSGPVLLQGEEYQRYYHAMVNYLTAVLVKIVLQSFRGTYWINNIIAVIARISAKMKVVGHDLPAATEQTLQNGSDARSRIQKQETKNAAYYANNPGFGFNRNYKAAPPLQNRAGYATKYFSEMDLLHNAVIHMLIDSLSAFAVSNHLAPGVDEFESSIALYESFITSEQILLCEQRDGGIGAASETGVTRAFTAGFEVCLRTWEALEKEPTSHTNVSWTSLKWRCSYVDDEGELRPKSRKGAVKLGFMTRVITATVPYAMSSGTFSASLHNLIDKILFSSGKDNRFALLLVEQPKMICTAILRTSQYESRRPTERENSDACPVSETFLLQKRAVGHNENGSFSDTYAQTLSWAVKSPNKTVTLSDREQAKKNLEAVKNKYFKWVTDANAIVISCKWYTWGSLVGCAILVLGGLAVGFTVGDRIHGVDPFNISVFCWVLAGFILLVAKAFRVENWPWSHFLRGQVTCRSVGEVVAVSGVDEQLLIALLLRIDSQIYLRTRGPFDILFLRHTDDIQGGFSIDAPIKMSTAVEGGLIPIIILADWGIGLIFLSARSWSSYNVISSSQNFKEELVCKDITHPASWVDGKIPCYRIRWEEVYVHQVLGVFEQECYFY